MSKNVSTGPIMCTQNIGTNNVCRGDEGSPVFVQIGGSWQLVGIVSNFPNGNSVKGCLSSHSVQITQVGGFTSFISSA